MSKELDAAVAQLLTAAQTTSTTSDDPAEIKQSVDALSALLREWQALDRRVESTVVSLIRLVQSRCKHIGITWCCNEHDGSWTIPCPTCGARD